MFSTWEQFKSRKSNVVCKHTFIHKNHLLLYMYAYFLKHSFQEMC